MGLTSMKKIQTTAGLMAAVFAGKLVIDPPGTTFTAGEVKTDDINIPSARIGDAVIACPETIHDDFVLSKAEVTAANTVRFAFKNIGAGTTDPGNVTVSLLVLRG